MRPSVLIARLKMNPFDCGFLLQTVELEKSVNNLSK